MFDAQDEQKSSVWRMRQARAGTARRLATPAAWRYVGGDPDICASTMGVSVCGCRPGTSGLQRIDGSAFNHRRIAATGRNPPLV
jgi:hypothetical protein